MHTKFANSPEQWTECDCVDLYIVLCLSQQNGSQQQKKKKNSLSHVYLCIVGQWLIYDVHKFFYAYGKLIVKHMRELQLRHIICCQIIIINGAQHQIHIFLDHKINMIIFTSLLRLSSIASLISFSLLFTISHPVDISRTQKVEILSTEYYFCDYYYCIFLKLFYDFALSIANFPNQNR